MERESGGRPARGPLLALVLVALIGSGLAWWLARGGSDRSRAGVASAAVEAPREERALDLDRALDTRQPTEPTGEPAAVEPSPAPAAAATTPETIHRPSLVLLSGAAIRVDAQGREHPGESGALMLYLAFDGRHEKHDVAVEGGRFALDVPPHAVVHVSELVLDGRAVRVLPVEQPVPEDRFLVLRGSELAGVLLHVLAQDGRELEGVDVHPANGPRFQIGWRHPGVEALSTPLVRGARSPVVVEPSGTHAYTSACYWVRATGHAWDAIELDHGARGERRLALQPACTLEVELVALPDWLRPVVRAWTPDQDPSDGYAFAEQRNLTEGRVAFEGLPPGEYLVTAERGWADRAKRFGQVPVTLVAGERTTVALELTLPERPREVAVSGTLVLNGGWEREGLALSFAAQGETSAWADQEITVPLAAMRSISERDPEVFAWSATLPVAGAYELAVVPLHLRRLLAVPAGGLADVEVVVPAPADVEVRVVDDESGAEIAVEQLYWAPPRVEGIQQTPLLRAARDPARGCIAFRAPAGEIGLQPVDMSLVMPDESQTFPLVAGRNEIELRVSRRIGVRFRLRDGETTLPWSWDWGLRAEGEGEARDVARSIDMLWFKAPGVYRLFAEGGVPGFASIDGTTFEVRPLAPGETELVVDVALRREWK